MIDEFESLEQLYKRLLPALKSKVSELKRSGYDYLTSEDVWNYLKETKWIRSSNLSLNDMVSDIFTSSNDEIDAYFKSKLNKKNRKVYFEEEE